MGAAFAGLQSTRRRINMSSQWTVAIGAPHMKLCSMISERLTGFRIRNLVAHKKSLKAMDGLTTIRSKFNKKSRLEKAMGPCTTIFLRLNNTKLIRAPRNLNIESSKCKLQGLQSIKRSNHDCADQWLVRSGENDSGKTAASFSSRKRHL